MSISTVCLTPASLHHLLTYLAFPHPNLAQPGIYQPSYSTPPNGYATPKQSYATPKLNYAHTSQYNMFSGYFFIKWSSLLIKKCFHFKTNLLFLSATLERCSSTIVILITKVTLQFKKEGRTNIILRCIGAAQNTKLLNSFKTKKNIFFLYYFYAWAL